MRAFILVAGPISLFFVYKVLTGDFEPIAKLGVVISALFTVSWLMKASRGGRRGGR